MTAGQRLRLAAPVALIYWLMLGSGLVLYTALRADDALALVPLWAGAITGTLLGQLLAVGNYRVVPALAIIAVVGFWMLPGYSGLVGVKPWVAVVPAGLCGYWSLGERGALAAWWFPTMLWMLSILDTIQGGRSGGLDAILGCAVAASFVLFLRVRESRRVALWCAVAATPLAVTRQPKVLREVPSWQLARAGWTVVTAGLTLVITAWLAPMFWRAEAQQTTVVTTHPVPPTQQPFERPPHEPVGPAMPLPYGGSVRYGAVRTRLPCCAVEEHVQVTRSRIKEYFDLGRGTDETEVLPHPRVACRVCRDDVAPTEDWTGGEVIAGTGEPWHGVPERGWQPYPHQPVPQGRPELPDLQGQPSAQPWQRDLYPVQPYQQPDLAQPYPQPQWQPSAEWQATAGRDPAIAARERSRFAATTSGTPITGGPPSAPTVTDRAADKPAPVAPSADKPTPSAASADKPAPAAPSADKPAPAAASVDKVAPTAPSADKPAPSAATDPPAATAPTATGPVASAVAKPAADVPASPVPTVVPPASPEKGLAVLHWLALLAAGGLILQLVALALRPVRRLVTLRHLRRPFWDETVDQRVSNSWQLALVGLRDAGWRPTSIGGEIEPPREFAQRVGVDGVERCATILERARHGIGIDAADLSDMSTAAETAYRSARDKLGPGARAIAMVRWPLT